MSLTGACVMEREESMRYEGRRMKLVRWSGAFSSLRPAPSHPIRNRLLTADSPDLLAVIKQEGKA